MVGQMASLMADMKVVSSAARRAAWLVGNSVVHWAVSKAERMAGMSAALKVDKRAALWAAAKADLKAA